MMTAKEMIAADKARTSREAFMRGARRWAEDDNKYTARKVCVKFARSELKNARKANRKLVALLAAGRARPMSLVLKTVMPLLTIAEERALREVKGYTAQVRAEAAAKGFDVAFPKADEPKFASYHDRYTTQGKKLLFKAAAQNARRSLAKQLMTDEGADRHAESEVKSARIQFLSFAAKLEGKVGAITYAELNVIHGVWGESYLTVVEADPVKTVVWKTQTIVNRSIYDKLFYQWPTRRK